MRLSEFKEALQGREHLLIEQANGELVPAHFHVTEVGQVDKKFIDCGGVIRDEKRVNFQLWEANDYDHRLHPEKLVSIIELSENKLGIEDAEIEVEYQGDTIGKFGLEVSGDRFVLTTTKTDCLAKDNCGIPQEKQKISLAQLTSTESESCCTPGSGCC